MFYDANFPSIKKSSEYVLNLFKWIVLSLIVGTFGGLSGVLFHYAVDMGAHFREHNPFVLFLLPLAGILIVFLYKLCGMEDDKGTNAIIKAVRSSDKISILVAPLILISTALTHLCGGSSGREGAALQIGGSIGSFTARALRLKPHNTSVLIMCGMSALFSAVFGTPLTAAIFSLEVVSVGIIHYGALFPSIMSALVANRVAAICNVEGTAFTITGIPDFDFISIGKILILASCAAIVSILFISLMHKTTALLSQYIKNRYLRVLVGAFAVIILTLLVGNSDYNGAGMSIIQDALEKGVAAPGAFILKLVFTVITLSAGFKGGEIVPTFFIGSTLGVFISPALGLDPSFAAAVGLIALFCGVVNCPVASIVLSIELFGSEGIIYFAIASAVSYIFSGNYSLYSAQKIVYSKLKAVFANEDSVSTNE